MFTLSKKSHFICTINFYKLPFVYILKLTEMILAQMKLAQMKTTRVSCLFFIFNYSLLKKKGAVCWFNLRHVCVLT